MSDHPPTAPITTDPFILGSIAPLPVEGPIGPGVSCVQCGYSLQGLEATGVCPECGTPCENSLRGNLLLYSGEPYLASLRLGVSLILNATLLMVACSLGGIVVGFVRPAGMAWLPQAFSVVMFALSAMSLYGWWRFSEPDPAYSGRLTGADARKVVRAATIAMSVVTALSAGIDLLPVLAPGVGWAGGQTFLIVSGGLALLSMAAQAVQFFAGMLYLRWLAPRIPDRLVYDRAKRNMWLLPLLNTVGVLLLLLGPLIALVMYWNLLDLVRKGLRRVSAQRAATGH